MSRFSPECKEILAKNRENHEMCQDFLHISNGSVCVVKVLFFKIMILFGIYFLAGILLHIRSRMSVRHQSCAIFLPLGRLTQ